MQPYLRHQRPLELAGSNLTQAPLARDLRDGALGLVQPGRSAARAKVKTVSPASCYADRDIIRLRSVEPVSIMIDGWASGV